MSNWEGMTVAEFNELPAAERKKNEYGIAKEVAFGRIKNEAIAAIDYIEDLGITNDYENGCANRERHLGWLQALVACYEQGSGAQSRQELQAQTEQTQFAASLADEVNELSIELRKTLDALIAYETAYLAVIYGRRQGVHYRDDLGNFTEYSPEEIYRNELVEKEYQRKIFKSVTEVEAIASSGADLEERHLQMKKVMGTEE